MRSSQAPSVATWLLKHLTPKAKNEALVGDLLEDFMQRRSAAWYWRQVLGSIFASLVQQLRSRGTPIRLAGIRILLAILSIPLLLPVPQFPGHRFSWLLLVIALAAFSSLLALSLRRLRKRLAASGGLITTASEKRIALALVGLMLCCLSAGYLSHHVALPLLVAIPTLLAVWLLGVWLALRWRQLYRDRLGHCLGSRTDKGTSNRPENRR